jgi:hypothetical protein
MRAAESKGIATLSALKDKTGVDRKTLRSINGGQAVKQTTLQSIADKLRIPISHLLNEDKHENAGNSIDDCQYREIKLQQLDAAALRKLASETDEITWFLNIDQMPELLETQLLDLRKSLNGWFEHINVRPQEKEDNLLDQISYIKTSANIDKYVNELAKHKLKIFGGTYVSWHKIRPFSSGKPLPILKYLSELRAALKITREDKTNVTVRVGVGLVPPREFVESELVGIDVVEIDGTTVIWSRGEITEELEEYLGIPF